MGYCSLADIERILAQSLTTASTDPALSAVPGKLTSIGRKLKLNLITDDDANYYIRLADGHVNSALSQQYVCPISETNDLETTLAIDVDAYVDDPQIVDAYELVPGDILYFTDGTNEEWGEVDLIAGQTVTLREPLMNLYDATITRVLRLKFPDPIPFISARLAAATIYDKYARAQQEPGKTEFGNTLRQEAYNELDNIREGRTILNGVTRRGWRFANSNLLDRYALKSPPDQDSTRSSQQGKS